MSWEARARKLEKRRRRMTVQGRGLITVEPQATARRLKKLAANGARRHSKR